jgi:ABC-type multidrug transport system fused ATPase/permease subunit
VLDEATSAVDAATDALIQKNLRAGFTGATLLVVAHHLATVADFDKVVVMGAGAVVECGAPRELWEDERGAWRGLCERSGNAERLREMVFRERE